MSKLWAKLAPAAARLERGSSDHDKVTAADVAHATAGLAWGPLLAGMTFLAGDDSQEPPLVKALSEHTGCSLQMAGAATWEMRGGELCRRCNGKGTLAPQVQCPTCLGRRRVKPTAGRLAERVGVSRATWYRRHARLYEEVFGTLEEWVSLASSHVHRRLRTSSNNAK